MSNSLEKVTEPALVLRMEGPEVNSGRIEAEHLAKILDAFQKALYAITSKLVEDRNDKPSHRRALAKKLSTLEVVALTPGSFSVSFALSHSHSTSGKEIGHSAIKNLVDSLQTVAEGGLAHHKNPSEIIPILPLAKVASLVGHGIHRIRVTSPGHKGLSAVLDENVYRSLEEISYFTKEYSAKQLAGEGGLKDLKLTAKTLLHSPLVGLWKDREEIADSSDFARQIRERAQVREK